MLRIYFTYMMICNEVLLEQLVGEENQRGLAYNFLVHRHRNNRNGYNLKIIINGIQLKIVLLTYAAS